MAFIPRGGAAECEQLVIDGSCAEEQLPVQRAGGHVERRGDYESPCAEIGIFPYEQRKSDIEADTDAELPPRGIEHRGPLARGEGIALAEALTALDVDIE